MPTTTDPADVVRAVMDGVCRLALGDDTQVERLLTLYADPTRVVHPMNPAIPPLLSRDDLRGHFVRSGTALGRPEVFDAVDVVVHRTADPEVVVADFRYEATRKGETSSIPCVFIVRVRDGLIVDSRDHAGRPVAASPDAEPDH